MAQGLTTTEWPARLQCLTAGRLVDMAGDGVELWLDGGHNPSAGEVLAEACRGWTDRPIDLVVGMMNTKDPAGFAQPLVPYVRRAICLSIPGEKNTLPAEEAARVLASVGIPAEVGSDIGQAVATLAVDAPSPHSHLRFALLGGSGLGLWLRSFAVRSKSCAGSGRIRAQRYGR